SEISRSHATQLSSVDFPQPEGPRSTRNSPSPISRLRFCSTLTEPKASDRSWMETLEFMNSSLHCARGDTANKITAGEEVNEQWHGTGQNSCGHIDVIFLHALHGIDDVIQLHGHRKILRSGKDHAEQKVVPDTGYLQNDRDNENRQRHRQHDLKENSPEAG